MPSDRETNMTRNPAHKERAKPAHPCQNWIPAFFISLSGLTALHASCAGMSAGMERGEWEFI